MSDQTSESTARSRQTGEKILNDFDRRSFIRTAGITTGAVTFGSLSGCVGDDESPAEELGEDVVPGERDYSGTTITWYDHESPTLEAFRAAAESWEESTGGTVEFEVATPEGVRDQQQTLFASGSTEMDIVGYPYQWGAEYVAGGHLEPLRPYVDSLHDDWNEADYIESVWEIYGKFEDGLYALPTKFDLWLAFWNEDHFEDAGLDPTQPPQTWDELQEYAETLDTDDHAGFDQTWQLGQADLNYLLYLKTHDVPVYDENGYPAFWLEENRDVAIEGVEVWQDIVEHSSSGYATMSFEESTSVFIQGETSLTYKWMAFAPVMLDPEDSTVADSLGWGLTAEGINRDQMLGGWGAGISGYSENKAAAFDLLAYATSPQNSLDGALLSGESSARQSVLENEDVREEQPWADLALDALERSFPRPKQVGWLETKSTLGTFMQEAITDENIDIEAELREVASEVWEISERSGANPGATGEQP